MYLPATIRKKGGLIMSILESVADRQAIWSETANAANKAPKNEAIKVE